MKKNQLAVYTGIILLVIGALWARVGRSAAPGPALLAPEAATAACLPVQNTPSFTIAYGEAWLNAAIAPSGSIVEAITPRGEVAGCFQVSSAGYYGTMYVYGEDTSVTPAIPGFKNNEIIVFRINHTQAVAMPALVWSNDRAMHKVDLSNLKITQSGNDAVLSWYAISDNMARYEVWQATGAPYFTPGDSGSVKRQTVATPLTPGIFTYADTGAVGDTATNNYYVVRGVSTAGKNSDSNHAGEYALSLGAGWNLIGLPLQVETGFTAQSLLDSLNSAAPYCNEVDRFMNADWDAHLNNLPFNNFTIAMGQGAYVKCAVAGAWPLLGEVLTSGITLNLHPGQNLVGFPYRANSYTAQTLLDTVAAQGGACSEVRRWASNAWEIHTNGSAENNFTLASDQGYFLKCTLNSTLTPQ